MDKLITSLLAAAGLAAALAFGNMLSGEQISAASPREAAAPEPAVDPSDELAALQRETDQALARIKEWRAKRDAAAAPPPEPEPEPRYSLLEWLAMGAVIIHPDHLQKMYAFTNMLRSNDLPCDRIVQVRQDVTGPFEMWCDVNANWNFAVYRFHPKTGQILYAAHYSGDKKKVGKFGPGYPESEQKLRALASIVNLNGRGCSEPTGAFWATGFTVGGPIPRDRNVKLTCVIQAGSDELAHYTVDMDTGLIVAIK